MDGGTTKVITVKISYDFTGGSTLLNNDLMVSIAFIQNLEQVIANDDIEIRNPYSNGEVVYFNPMTGYKSTDETGCMKWYMFGYEVGNTTVNLLLDHNIVAAQYCRTYGCLNNSDISTSGYWTSSRYSSVSPTSSVAWYIGDIGRMDYTSVNENHGLRPVITVAKSIID